MALAGLAAGGGAALAYLMVLSLPASPWVLAAADGYCALRHSAGGPPLAGRDWLNWGMLVPHGGAGEVGRGGWQP